MIIICLFSHINHDNIFCDFHYVFLDMIPFHIEFFKKKYNLFIGMRLLIIL